MNQNTILYSTTNINPNPFNLGKYAIYEAPQYQQNYYTVINNRIQTQYASISVSIIDSVYSGDSLTFLFSMYIPVLSKYPIDFLGIYDSKTNIVEFDGDTYYGSILFLSNKSAILNLKTGNGFQLFKSKLEKYN